MSWFEEKIISQKESLDPFSLLRPKLIFSRQWLRTMATHSSVTNVIRRRVSSNFQFRLLKAI